jgi:hypothetical protein
MRTARHVAADVARRPVWDNGASPYGLKTP